MVKLAFYRGIIDKLDMDFYQRQCCHSQENCDFSQYVSFDVSNFTYSPIFNEDSSHDVCSKQTSELIQLISAGIPRYNYESPHQDCYTNNYDFTPTQQFLQTISFRRALDNAKAKSALITDGQSRFVDQGSLINARSTDQFGGYRCLQNLADIYFNSQAVRKSLKIPDMFNNKEISLCKDSASVNYVLRYDEMGVVFQQLVETNYSLKVLLFNGDTDERNSFLAASDFVRSLNLQQPISNERPVWKFRKDDFLAMTAGFYETFQNNSFQLDLLTIAGGDHDAYSAPTSVFFTHFFGPKTKVFLPLATSLTRKEADRINSNYLHYWLVESQGKPETDPLILWFGGGPGCSSLGGLLTENGPFHPNSDGKTLFENNFSWNKIANVLYLESPRGAGFSYQDLKINADTGYSDNKTLTDNYLALTDFFSAYPEYQNRPFYVASESYGGIYVLA
uniref:Carboxypeptidase n=1 Tax=Ditylenchus dipsaci TaxID=166011 RepID=A0A915E3W1_9BILA